ncbi:MAG: NAD(P)-dependent alcohol dehydrogenase [Calditrichia bacterium]
MRAAVYNRYGSPEVLELREIEKPIPKDNEVLIKIYAATVTAVDNIFRRGDQFFARMATGVTKPKVPILGSDLAGEIEAVGKDVKLFKTGDQVFGDSGAATGTHAEYICLPETGPLALKPAGMTFEDATAIPYGGLTALPFLRDKAKIQEGQRVLVNGASGAVGSMAVQLSRNFGAEVTAVCSSANAELVKSLGADNVIDYKLEDFTQNTSAYDIIFDTIGKSSFSRCKRSLRPGGIYLTTVLTMKILLQMLRTSKMGSKKAVIAFTGLRPAAEKAKDLAFLKEIIDSGKLKPVIDRSFSLDQIAEAHRYVDQGHKKGNVIITIVHDKKG